MSSLIVEIVEIDNVMNHGNADKLEVAQIKGWNCVIGKGQFAKGDKAVYIPPRGPIS